jgi:hypothetical protein
MEACQAETPEQPLPAFITLPRTSKSITTQRAIAFTSDRFINSCARTATASAQTASTMRETRRAAQGAARAPSLPPHAHIVAVTPALAAILREDTPARLNAEQAMDLAEASRYYLAERITALLPRYLQHCSASCH